MEIENDRIGLSHFVELLSLNRDLVKNWEVDLSACLEAYLEEISKLDSSDGLSKVNFVEAALIIQKAAGIYGKKVEYLWQILLRILGSFNSKGEKSSEAKTGTSKRRGHIPHSDLDIENLQEFEPAEDLGLENQKWKFQPLNFKLDPVFISDLIHSTPSKKRIDILDHMLEPLCAKSDFRLNCTLSSNCMLEDELPASSRTSGLTVALQKTVTISNSAPQASEVFDIQDDEDSGHIADDENGNDHFEADCPSPEPQLAETEFPPARHCNVVRAREEVVTIVDPWKCDEINELPLKSVKKKCNFKLPCEDALHKSDRKRKRGDSIKIEDIKIMSKYLASDMVQGSGKKCLSFLPRFQIEVIGEFKSRKKNKQKRRLEEIEELRKQLATDYEGEFHGFEDYEPSSGEDEGFLGYPDELPDDLPDDHDDNSDDRAEDNIEFPLPSISNAPPVNGINGDDAIRDEESYAAVLRERINECANLGEQLALSDLAKRVSEWHDTIRPVLNAAEKRGHFDIHEYGTQVLECFPKGNRKTTIAFADVVNQKPKEDISRYFLASLMLANSYNIEISKSDPRDLAVDCMELTLLKSVRHHEGLEEYQAPSQLSRRS